MYQIWLLHAFAFTTYVQYIEKSLMMNGQKNEKKFVQMESTNQLGQLDNAEYFMVATQVAKEMKRYLKMDNVEVVGVQIEDIKETVVNDLG